MKENFHTSHIVDWTASNQFYSYFLQ